MSGFLSYLEEFELKTEKVAEKIVKKEKVVSDRNVEMKKKTVTKEPEKKFKIKPKKIIKDPIKESYQRAVDILEGINDSHDSFQVVIENNISQQPLIQTPEFNLNSVKGHASALL
jgi:hypothetical protein